MATPLLGEVELAKLLNHSPEIRQVRPLCSRCGVLPAIAVTHSRVTDELELLVYCHNENVSATLGLRVLTRETLSAQLAEILQAIRNLTVMLGGPPNPAPYITRADQIDLEEPHPTKAPSQLWGKLRRRKAAWDF